MIEYEIIEALFEAVKKSTGSLEVRQFFENTFGITNKEKKARLSIEKLVEDGYAKYAPNSNNYLLLTPKGAEFKGYNKTRLKSKTEKRIFLSHTTPDKAIANQLIKLFEKIGISKNDIFYTARRVTGIRSGKVWRDQLKEQLKSTEIFISLISEDYQQSEVCICEMGGAWVLDKLIHVVYKPPISTANFSTILSGLQANNYRSREEIQSFIEQLSDDYLELYDIELNLNELDTAIDRYLSAMRRMERKTKKKALTENSEIINTINTIESDELVENEDEKDEKLSLEQFDQEAKKLEASKKWPEDFEMRVHYVSEQKSAHNKISRLIKKNKALSEFNLIYKKSREKWVNDFEMVAHYLETQLKALKKFNKNE